MSETHEIIRDAGEYSMAALLTQFVTIVAAILTRRFLGPAQMGVWSLVQIILTYANYSHLGTMDAINREIPFYQGKRDTKKVDEIKNTAFSFSTLTAFIVSMGVVAYAFVRQADLSAVLFYGLLLAAGLVLLQRLNALLICLVRAYKRFELAGKLTFYSAVVNMILIGFLSSRYKLYGFMTAMALSFIFNISYVLSRENFHFRYSMGRSELRALLVYGFPLMILSLFSTFFETIDKIMITKFLGLEALGLYSVALMAYGYLYSIPNSISIVVIPNLHEKFGQTENKKDLKGYLWKSDLVFSTVMPVLIGLSWFIVPFLIGLFLPKFTEGIPALRLLILSTYFVGVGMAYSLFIYVIKKHWVLFPLNAAASGLAIVFNWLAIRRGWGIAGVAGATTLAMFCYFTMIYIYTASHLYSFREFLKKYGLVVLKFIWMAALLIFVTRQVRFQSPMLTIGAQSVLYGICYLPFLIGLDRKFGILAIWKRKFFKR